MFTRCTAQPCWHWLTRGTFDSATGGTFQSDTGGTFHSDTPGTFESDMDGTFKVSQSVYTVHRECRVECRLAIVWSIRNRGDAYLETGEGGPGGGLRLGGGFEVVGEIYEEVETGPGFYLVNADCVVLVAVGVGLVVEPESYAGRIGDRSAGTLHPEHQLVEVVRDRNSLGAGLAGTRVIYGASLALLFESHARHHVDLLVVALGNALDGILQIAPDSAVETVLDLRNLICHVESLGLHRGVSVARTVRTHVTSRIRAV